MEKQNDHHSDGDSPQESAIRFLLRHAECQRVLAISAWGGRQPLATAVRERDTDKPAQATAGIRGLVAAVAFAVAVVASPLAWELVAANESFRERFSPAHAAARHPPLSKRSQASASWRAIGSGPHQESKSAMAAA